MNEGKLEVVKQEMARVNIDILGISELKWTGMGEFNLDDQLYLLLRTGIPPSRNECCFHFASISSFFLELFLH